MGPNILKNGSILFLSLVGPAIVKCSYKNLTIIVKQFIRKKPEYILIEHTTKKKSIKTYPSKRFVFERTTS